MMREQSNILMVREQRIVLIVIALLAAFCAVCFFAPLSAFAAVTEAHGATGGHGGGEVHHPSIADLKLYWINFLLFLALMWFLLRNAAPRAWSARRLAILDAAERGKRAAEKAREEIAVYQAKLAGLPQESAALAKTIAEEGELEAKRIMEDARIAAQQIEHQASSTIAAEQRAFEQSLRREIASLVMEQVEARIGKELSPELDAELRRAAIGSARAIQH